MSSCPPGTRAAGSSPLARGLPHVRTAFLVPGGIIPARAGFTRGPPLARAAHRDHPRSRGVYAISVRESALAEGSSPLARGLRTAAGSVPARRGSSPLARGLHFEHDSDHRTRRIIPARAGVYPSSPSPSASRDGSSPLARGFTLDAPSRRCPCADHPRSRGGLHHQGHRPGPPGGIIPARAGVYSASSAPQSAATGSSPLARGFTPLNPPSRASPGDHPRSRGGLPHHRGPVLHQ